MSICPVCFKRIHKRSVDKTKREDIWIHQHCRNIIPRKTVKTRGLNKRQKAFLRKRWATMAMPEIMVELKKKSWIIKFWEKVKGRWRK